MKVKVTLLLALFTIVAGYLFNNTKYDEKRVVSNVVEQRKIVKENVTPSTVEDKYHLDTTQQNHIVSQSLFHEQVYQTVNYQIESSYLAELDWIELLDEENLTATDAMLHLQPMLSRSEAELRLAALTTISEYQYEEINYDLIEALNDPNPVIRETVVESFSMQKDDSVIAYLEPSLHDPAPQVRIAAIWAIAQLENDQSVYALSALLSDPNDDIRLNAVAALGEIGGDTSIYYLKGQLNDPDERIRQNVASILYEIEAEF
ncbi:MAG: HEAT repeat domain-containing protein [Candidatus Thiodiazotropha sp. DIVDIV]